MLTDAFLRADSAGGALLPAGYEEPSSDTETILAEILADLVGVERVSVDSHFFDDLGADSMVMARFCARVRKRPDLPSVSMKDIYQHPTISSLATSLAPAAATPTPVEEILAEVLAGVVGVERVSVDSHFFDDLGADSMVMAQFCARVRKRPDLPSVSMKDIYQHPTFSGLATALAPANAALTPIESSVPSSVESPVPSSDEVATPVSTPQYVLCGALQLLAFLGYSYLAGFVTAQGFGWISEGSGLIDIYLRAVLFGGALFVGVCTLPILAKWLLVGRWKPQQIRIWSLGYVRFWVVKTLVRANPLVLFAGSPLYSLYLRALGAKVGRGAAIFTPHVPVCTDLLTIGAGTVIRKESFLLCYRAHAGRIQTGAVTIGRDVFIGDKTVLDINTSMGDGAQLGHTSTLHSGQTVPDGERWHGSPAQRTEVDYRRVAPADYGRLRRASFSISTLLEVFFIIMPLAEGGAFMLVTALPSLSTLLDPNVDAITSRQFYVDALVPSLVFFFGAILVGLFFVFTVPRVFNRAITPDKVYPLYGFHYRVHHAITRMTNIKFFTHLFGSAASRHSAG